MGSNGQEVGSLMQCLPHQLVLLIVQTKDGLLEVAHTAVDQLGTATARTGGEVIALHQGSVKACVTQGLTQYNNKHYIMCIACGIHTGI